MKYCSKCGQEINDDAVICVHCGCAMQSNATVGNTDDAPSAGWWVLGFFIPIAGLILYLVNKDTKPQKAGSAIKGALVGFILGIVFGIISGIMSASLFASMY